MSAFLSLVAVLGLVLLAYVGVGVLGLQSLFGIAIPYAALLLLLVGIVWRVLGWARSPVPFRIPTACGQQRSLPWLKQAKLDNPSTLLGVIGRMALEVLTFRSLFQNTRTELGPDGRLVHGPSKWLWFGALAFHYSFLVIFLRHLRFFTEPVPWFVQALQGLDGFFEVGVPVVYITSLLLLCGLLFLLSRRLWIPQVRYISNLTDYFPLLLILGIGTTGFLLRHFVKTDVVAIKELGLGLLGFYPIAPEVHWLFYAHLLLVSSLFIAFPFSKLMHMAGVFLSPTRNLANNTRAVRHVNPWNHPVHVHTYEEYEDEFRDKMKAAGIPVDKE